MRIFIYEYICGGGLAGLPLPESLRCEGWAMLTTVLDDFRRLPDVQTTTLLDPRMAGMVQKRRGMTVDWVEPGAEFALFRDRVREADFTLVIAPEFDDILFHRCRWTEEVGGRLLGPSSAAVRLAADKLRLAELWQRHAIATPTTHSILDSTRDLGFPLVCKPRHGAGSQANFLIQNDHELRHALRDGALIGFRDEFILQKYARGMATSVSLLLGGGQCYALPAALQRLSDNGRFLYIGGSVPLADQLNGRAKNLALRAISPIDGLSGYVGVDLILGSAADGSDDVAIEINPRLTTSYVGLRALARFNLAEAMLALALRQPLPEMVWHSGSVRFLADGTVYGHTVQ